jgi:hypothetical protein
MERRLLKMAFALIVLAGSSLSVSAASLITTHVRAPALIRLDFTRPGGMPAWARDDAAARNMDTTALIDRSKPAHKRKPAAH